MAKRTTTINNDSEEALTDIPDEVEESPPTKVTKKPSKDNEINSVESVPPTIDVGTINATLSCLTYEEAQTAMAMAVALLEKAYNWSVRENQIRDPNDQLIFMAIDTVLRRLPLMRDGKVVLDANGAMVFQEPAVNIQIKLPLVAEAVSLPLHKAFVLPGGKK